MSRLRITTRYGIPLALLLVTRLAIAQASAPTAQELAMPVCQGQVKILESLSKAYFDPGQAVPKQFLLDAFKDEPHRPTREFMTKALAYVLDNEKRGERYLHSDRFIAGCVSVMGQKMAGIQANVRQQLTEGNGNQIKPVPDLAHQRTGNDEDQKQWSGASRR